MHIWDYREKDLKKTASGRRYILENMINMRTGETKNIPFSRSKKSGKISILILCVEIFLRYLIWGKR